MLGTAGARCYTGNLTLECAEGAWVQVLDLSGAGPPLKGTVQEKDRTAR